jgi:oxygen-independent coproporphyrinogen-3 oxidase
MDICLYFHYPFCLSKCPYCDFNSHVRDKIDYKAFEKSYLDQIQYFFQKLPNRTVKTIFFGGGTPSLMKTSLVEKIINQVSKSWKIADNCEITLECNPTSFEKEKFTSFKEAGINRVSIGIQSLDNKELRFLGRHHNSQEAISALESAAKIFNNYSFDLIYALPNQSLEFWQKQLNKALSFDSKHLSLYQLTIEKGTKFYKDFQENKFQMPSSDLAADFYEMTTNIMQNNNLDNYEISNFARKGFESKHNLNYWQGGDYLGIGAGAHSRVYFDGDNARKSLVMVHSPDKWLKISQSRKIPIQKKNDIRKEDLLKELILMSLRLKEGLTDKIIKFHFANLGIYDIFDKKKIKQLTEQGLIYHNSNILKITSKGRILTDCVISFLYENLNEDLNFGY